MSEYAQRFAENEMISASSPISQIRISKKLGVLLGHRRKMLRAIVALDSAPAAAPAAPRFAHHVGSAAGLGRGGKANRFRLSQESKASAAISR